jgi:hypothetical protein
MKIPQALYNAISVGSAGVSQGPYSCPLESIRAWLRMKPNKTEQNRIKMLGEPFDFAFGIAERHKNSTKLVQKLGGIFKASSAIFVAPTERNRTLPNDFTPRSVLVVEFLWDLGFGFLGFPKVCSLTI